MAIPSSTYAESFSFAPTALLSLYTLDSRFVSVNGAVYKFHAGVNGLNKSLIFNGEEYAPFPIEVTDFEILGSGGVSRPKLRASNVNGFISQFLRTQGDLVGAKVLRQRVYARFADDANWPAGNPYGTPDPTAAYDPDIFFVSRKVVENPELVELELSSPWEVDAVKLPRRPVLSTICSFEYRDVETCAYSGAPVCDRFGKKFTDSAPDGYGLTLSNQGTWSSSSTYQPGHWVTITSESDFSYGKTLVYVCVVANTTGSFNNPQFNSTNWIADACPHNLFGCKLHYPTGPLRTSSFAGTARAPYDS